MSNSLVIMPEELEYEARLAAGGVDSSPPGQGSNKQRYEYSRYRSTAACHVAALLACASLLHEFNAGPPCKDLRTGEETTMN